MVRARLEDKYREPGKARLIQYPVYCTPPRSNSTYSTIMA